MQTGREQSDGGRHDAELAAHRARGMALDADDVAALDALMQQGEVRLALRVVSVNCE